MAAAVYPNGVTDYAEATAKDAAVVEVGRAVQGRKDRMVELLKR